LAHTFLDLADTGKPLLVAIDGHCLAAVPCITDEGDTEGPITVDAIKLASKVAKRHKTAEIQIGVSNAHQLVDGTSIPRPAINVHGKVFPPWRESVPSYRPGTDGTVSIALNAALLAALAKALGNDIVRLTFPMPTTGDGMTDTIYVETVIGRAWGLLMPYRWPQ